VDFHVGLVEGYCLREVIAVIEHTLQNYYQRTRCFPCRAGRDRSESNKGRRLRSQRQQSYVSG
jgi:hypothetical protein